MMIHDMTMSLGNFCQNELSVIILIGHLSRLASGLKSFEYEISDQWTDDYFDLGKLESSNIR
jgi:hypothetical protein